MTLSYRLTLFFRLLAYRCKIIWYWQRIHVYPWGFGDLRPDRRRVLFNCDVPIEYIDLVTRDKVTLRCLLVPNAAASTPLRGTVIVFHEEIGNIGHAVRSHAEALAKQGFAVFLAEYRGYGYSDGVPSESGLKVDAQAALDFVANRPELSKAPIVVFGHSLGGAVAIDVTSRNTDKVSALILENTYRSFPHLIQKWYPALPRFLSHLCTQRWNSTSKIARLPPSLPILMLTGPHHSVIASEMAELWGISRTRGPKKKKKNAGLLKAAFKWEGDEEEGLIRPEKDVFGIFDFVPEHIPESHLICCGWTPSLFASMHKQPEYWTAIDGFLNEVVPCASRSSPPAL